ncbi:MAG: CheR family methyltransferase [Flavobacteriales bacterium]
MAEAERFLVSEDDVERVIEIVFNKRGMDFSGYSRASFSRRIQRICDRDSNGDFETIINRVSEDKPYFDRFLKEVTVNVTEMFRDPTFFLAIREKVLPELAHHHKLRTWHAACSTGEEVYSMATLLHEANLLDRSVIYGTDLNSDVLAKAKNGVYSAKNIREYTQNYQRSGGTGTFSDYYSAAYGNAVFKEFFRKNMVFSEHNLVTDGSFNEFNLIMCRNVLIYFQKPLQSRVIRLFKESLAPGGFLCLGSKESLMFADDHNAFEEVDSKEKIYRKKVML